jgi:hypothetical protein
MHPMVKLLAALSALLLLPLIASAGSYAISQKQQHWSRADRSPTGLSPDPATTPEAVVQVFASRSYRWRGIFGVHTWISIKPAGADRYTRFDVMGWGRALRVNGFAPDSRWFGRVPDIVFEARGKAAAAMIPAILAAVEAYPYADHGQYVLWPGPNSNTFTAWVARRVPGMDVHLPPLAVGKDFAPGWLALMPTPSKTGWQVSVRGYAGGALGWREGLELHLFGLTLGLDVIRPAVKLPGLGRIGLPPSA